MNVKFKLNKELDKNLISSFLNINAGGIDFSKNILRLHPKLKQVKNLDAKKKKAFISKYVNEYYKKNLGKINEKMKAIDKSWGKIEQEYLQKISKVFGIKRKIKQKYSGNISIINANPRWVSKKEFCIGYNQNIKYCMLTICHELTHFFFYNFINKKYPGLDPEKKWDLSEIFNVIILNEPQFKKLYKPIKQGCYPSHKKNINKFNKLYKNSKNINDFFKKSIKEINN